MIARYYDLTFIPSIVLGFISTLGLDLMGWYQGESPEQFCEVTRLFGPVLFILSVMTAEEGIKFIRRELSKVKV